MYLMVDWQMAGRAQPWGPASSKDYAIPRVMETCSV